MGSFGHFKEFDSSVESWTMYTERLEQYFVANAIENADRRRAIFLTVIGPSTYALLRNLISPDAPTGKTIAELINALNAHFDPAPSVIVERYKFNSRVRRAGESVATFIAELRRLARHCNYGASLDEMLRDRIVCGIQNESIQRKLLAESELTLARATEIAVTMEAAARDAGDLRTVAAGADINKIQIRKNGSSTEKTNKKNSEKCYRCGDNHAPRDCRFKNATCYACKKAGHVSKVCRSKKNQQNSRVHKLDVQESQETKVASIPGTYTLYNITVPKIGEALPPAKVECLVENKSVIFEIDTGAPYSLMPLKAYNPLKRYFPPLEPTEIKLNSYTEHPIDVMGLVQVQVSHRSKSASLPLIIVKQGTVNLAGRNWVYPLDLMSTFTCVSQVNKIPQPLTIQTLLTEFKDLFTADLGLVKNVMVHLEKKEGATPKFFKARPVPYALRDKVEVEITRLVQEGILEPVTTAEYAAPIVPVLKHDGRIRICGDFKLTTNKVTELEQYPLPNIEDIFAQLAGGSSFSKLDLRDAYCQLQLDEESRKLVTINTHKGLFQYSRLPFGVASAPAVFQREMDKILQGLKGASCYLDDLLVTGRNTEEHLQNLKAVLMRLQQAGIKLHPEKCEFLKPSVEYLGHRIDKEGLHPVESKVEAIVDAPEPKNIDELRSFIGLITYYAKFLPNMATLLAPLYELLKIKQAWSWGPKQREAFKKVKETLINSSLLMHFDITKEVVLACDASPYGLGAVLSHQTKDGDRPVAFASRCLTNAEKNYSHIEKETLALVFGVTKFRKYLLGRTFVLLTDHRPLVNLLSQDKPVPPVAAARIQRWALTLSAYSYKIKYRKGSLHSNADACSRLPLPTNYADPPIPAESVLLIKQLDDSPVTRHLIAKEIDRCSDLCMLRSFILTGFPSSMPGNLTPFWKVRDELSLQDDLIMRGSRVFIPPKFKEYILNELHSAHQGISATKALARSYVWWPGIDRDIEAKVKECAACQQNASAPPSKQSSWPTPEHAWQRIHIDHAGPVDGHTLLIVVDAKTKWLEVIPVSSTSSFVTITVLRSLFARFGIPKSLVSDNGPGFRSEEFGEFLAKNGVDRVLTAPYHPKSNGIAERAVRTTKEALKKINGSFEERLARFLFNYRNTPHASTGISPAFGMFGRSLRSRLDLLSEQQLSIQSAESNEKPQCSNFKVGEPVWVQNFRRGPKWIAGKIIAPLGRIMFRVETSLGAWTRHADQIRPRAENANTEYLPVEFPDPVVAAPYRSVPQAIPVGEEEKLDESAQAASPGPPVLSPQKDIVPSSIREDLPVLSPQVRHLPRRSGRFKCKPNRLQL